MKNKKAREREASVVAQRQVTLVLAAPASLIRALLCFSLSFLLMLLGKAEENGSSNYIPVTHVGVPVEF